MGCVQRSRFFERSHPLIRNHRQTANIGDVPMKTERVSFQNIPLMPPSLLACARTSSAGAHSATSRAVRSRTGSDRSRHLPRFRLLLVEQHGELVVSNWPLSGPLFIVKVLICELALNDPVYPVENLAADVHFGCSCISVRLCSSALMRTS